jgi:hypothetical protein
MCRLARGHDHRADVVPVPDTSGARLSGLE